MKHESDIQRPLVEKVGQQMLVSFDMELKTVDDHTTYLYNMVWMPYCADYGTIVSAIIADRYTNDEMQAIINNHLLESEDDEHKKQFAEMQAWRKHAKMVAKAVIEYEIEHIG